MEIALTKMSSKGQIVIPSEMRKDIPEGEKLFLIKDKKRFIIKRAKDFEKKFAEDLLFAKRTEEAWKRYERGEFKEMDFEDFLKEARKW